MNRSDEISNEAETPAAEPASLEPPAVPFRGFLLYFLELGSLGFGGPIATVGYMQRDLVEQRAWMSKQDLVDGIALGQTMPGPLAAQVAMWIGYLRRGALRFKLKEPTLVFAAGAIGLLLHGV